MAAVVVPDSICERFPSAQKALVDQADQVSRTRPLRRGPQLAQGHLAHPARQSVLPFQLGLSPLQDLVNLAVRDDQAARRGLVFLLGLEDLVCQVVQVRRCYLSDQDSLAHQEGRERRQALGRQDAQVSPRRLASQADLTNHRCLAAQQFQEALSDQASLVLLGSQLSLVGQQFLHPLEARADLDFL